MAKLRRGKSLNDFLQRRNKLASSQLVALFKHLVKGGSHFLRSHDLIVFKS